MENLLDNLKYNILVVDDNPNNIYTLKTILSRIKDSNIIEASSGDHALIATIEHEIDLILLDVQMPGMDGFETAKHLKLTEKTRDIPIIFVTAVYRDEEFFKHGYAIGAVDYLTKPIDDSLLLNRVNHYLKLFERERKLKETLKSLKEKEAMLIHQSRLAAMGEMIAAIAHQWRQPLNAISILIQDMVDASDFGEFNKDYLYDSTKKMLKQIDYMNSTIEDFMNFFKPNKEKICFKVSATIKETLLLIHKQLVKSNISINLDCKHGNETKRQLDNKLFECGTCQNKLTVYGYPNEFKQVILNIIANARDAILKKIEKGQFLENEKGEISINLSFDSNKVKIEIKDNGGGIPDDIKEKIYEPYFTNKEAGYGLGIGLYMSKTIIEKNMQGCLTAKNEGKGALFTIELDIAVEPL